MLTVKKELGRQTAKQYKQGEPLRWDIPCGKGGDVIVDLWLRCHGTMTIGVAAATALQARGMERALRSLRLFAEHKEISLEGALRSYTARGVNDAAGGRTASLAGIMLALEALLDEGTPVEKKDPGLTVAEQSVDIIFPLRFKNPRAKNPWLTCLDTRVLRNLYLEIEQGILDTTAAGDDTDALVTDATTTVVSALNWDLWANVLKRVPAGLAFDVRKVRTATAELSVGDDVERDIGEDGIYRRIVLVCTDDDVLSDARISEVSAIVDDHETVARGRWSELRGEVKADHGIESLPAGMAAIVLPSGLDTRLANSFRLGLNVPAGAAVADDRLFCLIEELVRMPKPQGGVQGTRGRRGGGRRAGRRAA